MKTRKVQLENSDVWLNCHLKKDCRNPKQCTVHARTDHHMRSWVQHWRADRGIMERLCPDHQVGHVDPDDYRVLNGMDLGIHGCCGCCVDKNAPENWSFKQDVVELDFARKGLKNVDKPNRSYRSKR
jgi:hypothetical protein